MKLLIIGAGYVGEALLVRLQKSPYEVIVTTKKKERIKTLQKYGQVFFLDPNIDEGFNLETAVSRFNELIDACDGAIVLVAPGESQSYEDVYLGTAEKISCALKNRKKPFYLLYTSSTSVYEGINSELGTESLFSNSSGLWIASKPRGWLNRSQVNIKNMDLAAIFHPRELSRDSRDRFNLKTVSEEIILNPVSVKSKVLLKTECCYLNSNAATCILRLGGIYGPDRELIDRAKRFSGKEMPGTGYESTNHIHLDDIVAALLFCLEHSITGVYNLVNDDHPTRKELYTNLCRTQNIPSPIWKSEKSLGISSGYLVSNQKIKDVGFTFKHSL